MRPPVDELDPLGVVLAEVRDMGPVTVAEIASGTGLAASTVRRHLTHLEETQLVESDDYQRRARVYMDARKEPPVRPVREPCRSCGGSGTAGPAGAGHRCLRCGGTGRR